MRNSAYLLTFIFFCISCETNMLPSQNEGSGQGGASFTISLMQPGVLAKKMTIVPKHMIITLSASGEKELIGTVDLDADYSETLTIPFNNLAAPLDWTAKVVVFDNNDRKTHEKSMDFKVEPDSTTTLEMHLPALFSMLEVVVPQLKHSVDYGEIWIDGSLAAETSGVTPLRISLDYLTTDKEHTIELKLFSTNADQRIACYQGTAVVRPESGKNQKLNIILNYSGPAEGTLDAEINVGEVGQIVVIATEEPPENYALHFDSGVVEVPSSNKNVITGSISISAWVRIEANPAGFGPIVSKWNDLSGAARRSFALTLMRDRSARFDIDANGSWGTGSHWSGVPDEPIISTSTGNALLISKKKINLSEWVHVAGVFDAVNRSMKLYVNGELDCETVTVFSSILSTDEPILVGAGDHGGSARQYLNGDLDDISIWDRPLAPAEVLALADREKVIQGSESGLNTFWDMNEGAGITIFDASPNWNSGNFIEGSGSGIPQWFAR